MNLPAAELIAEHAEQMTAYVIEQDYARRPELQRRYGDRGRTFYARDNRFHLSFLAEAMASGEAVLFVDYIAWARSMLTAHGVLLEELSINLDLLCEALQKHLPDPVAAEAIRMVRAAQDQLPAMPEAPPAFLREDDPQDRLVSAYLDRLLAGDRRGAEAMVTEAVADGLPLKELYLGVFQRSQWEIGRRWQMNQITVAEEHFCTAATQAIMNQFYRRILDTPRNGLRMTALCVAGDLHEIGLRIVADFFELAGWDSEYIGANTPTSAVLAQLQKRPPDLVAISATMSYHVREVALLIAGLREIATLEHIPVLVGGRPFTIAEDLWRIVGADGCAVDAEGAIARGLELVAQRRPRE